jgi:hypothetical protein
VAYLRTVRCTLVESRWCTLPEVLFNTSRTNESDGHEGKPGKAEYQHLQEYQCINTQELNTALFI